MIGAAAGAIVGLVLAAIAGGVCAMIYGVPFSGVKGVRAFPSGMLFPGLLMIGPVAAGVCAAIGALCCLGESPVDKRKE